MRGVTKVFVDVERGEIAISPQNFKADRKFTAPPVEVARRGREVTVPKFKVTSSNAFTLCVTIIPLQFIIVRTEND